METKEFSISRFSISWRLALRLIIAAVFLLTYLFDKDLFILVIACLFLAWTVFYLTRPHTIILDDNEIVFRSLLFKDIRIDVDHLISIKDEGGGWYARFRSEKISLTTLSGIKNRSGLLKYIHSLNSNIEIKQASGTRKGLSFLMRLTGTIIVLFIFSAGTYRDMPYRSRSPNASASADLKNAYTAAQAYHTDYPNVIVTLPLLKSYGLVQSKDVEIEPTTQLSNCGLRIVRHKRTFNIKV